jgi:uncharacterized membrane protein
LVTLLRWALAIGFVVVGIDKLRSESIWPAFFADLPGGDLLRYLTAMIQIAGGLLMMRATTLTAGLGLIALTMAGAIATWFVAIRRVPAPPPCSWPPWSSWPSAPVRPPARAELSGTNGPAGAAAGCPAGISHGAPRRGQASARGGPAARPWSGLSPHGGG